MTKMKIGVGALVIGLALSLIGCAAWFSQPGVKHSGSVVNYLYPNAEEAPQMKPSVTYLRPPVRVGIAFVPGSGSRAGLTDPQKEKLLERVKASFAHYDYIGSIEIIPTEYLRPGGGFANLSQVARMFNVEVMALVSYDQIQFNDTNSLSVLYWTVVGAYIIHGDQYDVQTMVDASVFDVRSHKLLFRAPGTSRIKGGASLAGFSERSRAARTEGYDKAVAELIPRLQSELQKFKVRLKSDTSYKVVNKPGYSGGGDFGWLSILIALSLAGVAYRTRRKA